MSLICEFANARWSAYSCALAASAFASASGSDEPSARNTYGSWGRRMCANTNFGPGAVATRRELPQLEQRALAVAVAERGLGRRDAEDTVDRRA